MVRIPLELDPYKRPSKPRPVVVSVPYIPEEDGYQPGDETSSANLNRAASLYAEHGPSLGDSRAMGTTELSKCAPLKATVKLPDNMVCVLDEVHTAREQDGMLILESFDYGLVAAFTKGEWLSVTITTPERGFSDTKPGRREMRIVNRIEFLKLPSGTLFCQASSPWGFDDLHVKWDSLIHHENGDGDFVCAAFTMIENDGSTEYFNRLDEMAGAGASYPLDIDGAAQRDGKFDRGAYFLVYEKEDVQKLSAFFAALAAEA